MGIRGGGQSPKRLEQMRSALRLARRLHNMVARLNYELIPNQ